MVFGTLPCLFKLIVKIFKKTQKIKKKWINNFLFYFDELNMRKKNKYQNNRNFLNMQYWPYMFQLPPKCLNYIWNIQFWPDLTQSQHTISSFECSLQACFFHSPHFWRNFWWVIWIPKDLMTFVVGKFKPFGYCALKCTYLVWLTLHQTHKEIWNEHEKNHLYQQMWVESGIKHMYCMQIYPRCSKRRRETKICLAICTAVSTPALVLL